MTGPFIQSDTNRIFPASTVNNRLHSPKIIYNIVLQRDKNQGALPFGSFKIEESGNILKIERRVKGKGGKAAAKK